MIDYELSEHAYDMLRERNIQESWVKLAIEEPEIKEFKDDGTVHYIRAIERAIEQYGGRFLRVVVNPSVRPQRIVTVFFDRRIGGRNETKGGSQE
ncbi:MULTISPECIES: DUF4258 domain-containing protein [Caldilinea]|jgi:hypothetical protein|uniref:DUF4258 domain-containing protein n=1 Tax=Caldilinea TaxID=233191 RepID=UPI0005C46430|nr:MULTISPECIES: DUF4258 domain-containing protein [Caldilinea]GIV71885.1 MAG: hypothetical protein KatS3mg049_0441 [Caldilinea sp.]